MRGSEGALLGLGVEVLRITVEHKLSHWSQGVVAVGPDLRNVVNIKSVSICVCDRHDLDKPVPGGGASVQQGLVQVTGGEILVLHSLLGGFGVSEVLDPLCGLEVVLNQECLSFSIDPLEGMRAVAIHVTVPVRGASVREQDHDLVLGLRRVAPEVKGGVWVLNAGLGVTLLRVDEVRELNRILDEEHRGVVTDHVVIALLGVEFNGESSRIAVAVIGAALACDGGEPNENRGLFADLVEESCLREPINLS